MNRFRIREDIKAIARSQGKSLADVARDGGISYATVCGVVAGRACPTRPTAERIAAALDEPVEALFPEHGSIEMGAS